LFVLEEEGKTTVAIQRCFIDNEIVSLALLELQSPPRRCRNWTILIPPG
jgi:hypothetical protein